MQGEKHNQNLTVTSKRQKADLMNSYVVSKLEHTNGTLVQKSKHEIDYRLVVLGQVRS